jgi:hypothetical protein
MFIMLRMAEYEVRVLRWYEVDFMGGPSFLAGNHPLSHSCGLDSSYREFIDGFNCPFIHGQGIHVANSQERPLQLEMGVTGMMSIPDRHVEGMDPGFQRGGS